MNDIVIAKKLLRYLPKYWDGKKCILELKEANYNWRQMEWWAFYFEWQCNNTLECEFLIPGDRINNVTFDAKREINWDYKAKAIKSDDHRAILNDCEAMELSIDKYGAHGEIIALCDVEYNDVDRSFQQWHTKLKGGKSQYELNRIKRTSVSRYRKVSAELTEIIFLIIYEKDLDNLSIMHQGRNSNGRLRPPKYLLDLENINSFKYSLIQF